MSKAKKAAYPDEINRDLPKEGGAELRSTLGESSFASASPEEKDRITMETSNLPEKVVEHKNLYLSYKRIKKNGGSHGVDSMKVEELLTYLLRHGEWIKQDLLAGKYRPHPFNTLLINNYYLSSSIWL